MQGGSTPEPSLPGSGDAGFGSGRAGEHSARTSASSDDGNSLWNDISGPYWMEDPSPVRRRSQQSNSGAGGLPAGRLPRDSRQAIAIFNKAKSAEKAVAELVKSGFLPEPASATAVAGYLVRNDGKLDLAKVGDFLGGSDELNKGVCNEMLQTLNFEGMPLDRALRRMISLIKLPGEAQKIDRIIEQFAINWVAANPGVVDHVDTAQIIAFSLVMLNVDAHNDAIKKERRMTLEQYTRNLRGICKDGSSPDPQMLGGFYERVARFEWAVEEKIAMTIIHQGCASALGLEPRASRTVP